MNCALGKLLRMNNLIFYSKKYKTAVNELKKNSVNHLLQQTSKIKVNFQSKFELSKNNYIFRFNFEDEDACLGVEPCQFVNIQSEVKTKSNPNGELLSKPYHPISLDTDKGFVDFLIKIYNNNDSMFYDSNYGVFSNFLYNLEKGQTVELTGPYGNIKYKQNGLFQIKDEINNTTIEKKIKRIGLIAGGTGITPMFQLIRKIFSNKKEKIGISLIYATKTIEEIAFCHDLVEYDKQGKIYFFPVIEEVNIKNWFFGKGRINTEILQNYLPSANDEESLVMICGPDMMTKYLKQQLTDLNYKSDSVFSFS